MLYEVITIKSELSNPQLIGATFFGKIAEMSSIDPLTKVYNRQHLNQILESEYLRYNRYKVSFSVALIDIDHFKEVNDTRTLAYNSTYASRGGAIR